MTKTSLTELERLISEATQGPYSLLERGGMGYEVDPIEEGVRGSFEHYEDAALVMTALNALPGLIAAARERNELQGQLEAARRDALMEAAKLCEGLGAGFVTGTARFGARCCAQDIRALAGAGEGGDAL